MRGSQIHNVSKSVHVHILGRVGWGGAVAKISALSQPWIVENTSANNSGGSVKRGYGNMYRYMLFETDL